MNNTILTDANGRPIPKPHPEDYESATEWLRAYHAYQDRVTDIANAAFTKGFREALKGECQ